VLSTIEGKIVHSIQLKMNSMRQVLLGKIRQALNLVGVELTRYEGDQEAAKLKNIFSGLIELAIMERAIVPSEEVKFLTFAQRYLHLSKSQILQDLFVLHELGEKEDGYFVEFGATNGVDSSNSYMLEKFYNWNGILAEPGKVWHERLSENRRCKIDHRCVWSQTGEDVEFNQVNEPELSTINAYSGADRYRQYREDGSKYYVETISLNDLLRTHGAPREIDYMSIDTEGSEYQILSAFDFEKYRIKIITCEHNYTDARGKLFSLLSAKGYLRKFQEFSQVDDWYVKI
jgi:FkbM family methyltransferase